MQATLLATVRIVYIDYGGPTTIGLLTDVKIVEFAGLGPAPFCAMILADIGAEVLHIDRPAKITENGRRFQVLSRGRRSVMLDLKQPEDVEVALTLVTQVYALIEGNRPGVMERLALGPDICADRNPKLVFGRTTGCGRDGPLAAWAGHDITYLAPTGALWSIGRAGEVPIPPLKLVADLGGGAMSLATGLLAALLGARSSGKDQFVDAAMIDGVNMLLSRMHGFHAT